MRKIFTLLLMAIMAVGYSWAADETFDFVGWKFDGANSWEKTGKYDKRTVNGEAFVVTFARASRQSGTVTDCPVVQKDSIVVMSQNETTTITGVEVTLKKWNSKAKIIYLYAYNGKSYGDESVAQSSDFFCRKTNSAQVR